MEKDKRLIIITEKAKEAIKEKKIKPDFIYNKENTTKLINTLINTKKEITIYDTTYIKTKKKLINVKDHINKTGENPLVGKQKQLHLDFIDITKIYKETKDAVTTTSVGQRTSDKKRKTTKNSSTDLSNIAILCYALGHKNIEAKLINLF